MTLNFKVSVKPDYLTISKNRGLKFSETKGCHVCTVGFENQ